MTLNISLSCLHFSSARITGVCHFGRLYVGLDRNSTAELSPTFPFYFLSGFHFSFCCSYAFKLTRLFFHNVQLVISHMAFIVLAIVAYLSSPMWGFKCLFTSLLNFLSRWNEVMTSFLALYWSWHTCHFCAWLHWLVIVLFVGCVFSASTRLEIHQVGVRHCELYLCS